MISIEQWITNSILRAKSSDISLYDITSWKYNNIVDEMKKEIDSPETWKITLWIAAPQIGLNIRLIIVREILKSTLKWEILQDKVYEMFNPRIISSSTHKNSDYEGCLSIPWVEDRVERASSIVVMYTNKNWEEVKGEYQGLNARVVQHEIDHLDWILFTDYIKWKNYNF